MFVQLTLNKREALLAGVFVKRGNIDFTELGSRYRTDFDKQEFAQSGRFFPT